MALIYLVEDDVALRSELSNLLGLQGFEVAACADFARAAAEALELSCDMVLLDLKLPSVDGTLSGHAICRDIRKSSSVPIIVLTSVNTEFDEVMAMNLGATDYVTKPYRPAVLIARMNAILRRESDESKSAHELAHGGVTLNLSSSTASFGEKSVLLTRNEQHILALLMANPGTIISRSEIMCDLWESDAFIDDNTLTVNVNRLRKTLSELGVPDDFLQTRRGLGYVV